MEKDRAEGGERRAEGEGQLKTLLPHLIELYNLLNGKKSPVKVPAGNYALLFQKGQKNPPLYI